MARSSFSLAMAASFFLDLVFKPWKASRFFSAAAMCLKISWSDNWLASFSLIKVLLFADSSEASTATFFVTCVEAHEQ